MIRRAFLRRMASAAMAGMLGLELASRIPVVEPHDPYTATYPQWTAARSTGPPLTEEMLLEMIARIRRGAWL